MLKRLWDNVVGVIVILMLIVMIVAVIGIFLSPAILMFVYHWTAGFLFFVSWIPAIGAGVISINIISLFKKIV